RRSSDLLRVPLLALLLVASLPAVALAQAAPVPPTERVVGRVLTLDEAIAIALEAQPSIQATLYDYAGARARVREAFAPLLPQLSGSVSATRSSSSAVQTSTVTRQTVIVSINRQPADTFLAQVQLSQLLFDFGKTMAATQVARKLAEVSAEGVELQRQLIALTVKEAYTNILLAQRLIRVQEQAVERAALRTEALRQSPEYRQARLQSAAAEASVQHASRNFLPNISGTGSYGGSQLELNPTWSLGVVFSWNIFDGGNLIAVHDEAK